jgi:predicted 2-oxoglutarate/Fe(II)-dependent dioxygenase YbiX
MAGPRAFRAAAFPIGVPPANLMTTIPADLAAQLATVRRPGDFFATGTTELLAPLLEVEGVGPVALPLLPVQAGQLAAAAEPAPYGRGAATLVDPAVRRCRQIGPDRVRISGRHWGRALETIVARAAEGLGVDGSVSAEFYKLLLYEQGDFFVGHRDTEKAPGMFATLVVALPSSFVGGELVVRHKGREVRLNLRCDDPAEVAFAAFYADCVHEVLPVTEGCRLILVYNLVRRGRGRSPEPPDYAAEQARLTTLLRSWCDGKSRRDDDAPEKLVYPLEHAYTPAELGFAALKGADAAMAGVLAAAARDAQCDLHLALLTVEESGAAEYSGSYGSRRGRWGREEDEFEACEDFDRSMTLSDWRRPDGGTPALGDIPVEAEEFSPPDACDELEPDEEHFHEATGNEGASFERSYRRAALVLWPSDRIFAVLSQAGLRVTLPYFADLTRRWAETDGDRRSPLWREAHDLAGHMLARWPRRDWYPQTDEAPGDAARMLTLLTQLDDAELIERFLGEVTAAGVYGEGDNAAVIAALGRLPPPRAAALVERVVAGTAGSAFGACANLLARAAAASGQEHASRLAGAAARLVEALPGDPARAAPREPWQRGPRVNPAAVVDLLAGLGAIDAALAERAVDHILARPKTYSLDTVLVPAARALVGAGTTRGAASVERLRAACVAHLRVRVAEPLAPPVDLRRAARLSCRCSNCIELGRFLADPERQTWILKAAEADRRHVEDCIRRAEADLDISTDRRGRPYSLVCTKNQASYERRARQRRQDLKDLALLAG